MSLLEVTDLTHSYGDKVLYKDASFDLYKGEHMGVVGQNGAGKSTLIGILTGEVVPDKGEIKWQPNIRYGYLDQYAVVDKNYTILNYLKTAFQALYQLEERVNSLYEQYSTTQEESLLLRASKGQNNLELHDFYSIDTRIDKVVTGLGLDALGTAKPLDKLSGGQRAKVILAKLLLEQPDILLLDEPTNFLDKEHVDWLVEYLSAFQNAFIVVSHDFAFLDRISTCICDVEAESIRKYHGKYTDFLVQKEHLREDHIRRYTSQQQVIKRTEEFIRKNIAGTNSKNAKGRRKQLEHLERIAAPTFTSKPSIHFQESGDQIQKPLVVKDLQVGYGTPLLPKLNFSLLWGVKMVITGFNGIGKSTLLKTLVGQIEALSGSYHFAKKIKIGYYEQDLHWENKNANPIQIIGDAFPSLTEKVIRKHLAACGVKKDSVRQSITTLSGGEQSKVKLCRLLLSPYNFLILDEPTNHLDSDTKAELRRALIAFQGSVILVSHEAEFYKDFTDHIVQIEHDLKGDK